MQVGQSIDENTILLNKNADPDVAIEELVESVIKQLKELDAPLYQEILEEAQRLETINTKNSGIEAISKAFVYGFLRVGDNEQKGTMHPVHEQIYEDNAYLSSSLTSKLLDYFVDKDGVNILEEILDRNEQTFGLENTTSPNANGIPTWATKQEGVSFVDALEKIREQKRREEFDAKPKLITEGTTDVFAPSSDESSIKYVRTSARGKATRVIYDINNKPEKVKEGQLELFNDPAEDSEIIKATNEYIDFLGEQYDLFDGDTYSFNPWDVEVQQEYRSEGTAINIAQGNLPQGMTALLYSGEEGTG